MAGWHDRRCPNCMPKCSISSSVIGRRSRHVAQRLRRFERIVVEKRRERQSWLGAVGGWG